jgi:hypothetical protein
MTDRDMQQKQMAPSDQERQSMGQVVFCFIVFIASAAIVTSVMQVAWRDWTVFAFGWAALYFMGGMRGFPWRTPLRKAFSIGVFVGTALPTIVWIFDQKQ